MLEILRRDWNFKPIFTQKWASVDMNWGGVQPLQPPAIPTLTIILWCTRLHVFTRASLVMYVHSRLNDVIIPCTAHSGVFGKSIGNGVDIFCTFPFNPHFDLEPDYIFGKANITTFPTIYSQLFTHESNIGWSKKTDPLTFFVITSVNVHRF